MAVSPELNIFERKYRTKLKKKENPKTPGQGKPAHTKNFTRHSFSEGGPPTPPARERDCATSARKPPKIKDFPRKKIFPHFNQITHFKIPTTPHRQKERESANSACRDEALAKAGPKLSQKLQKVQRNAQEMTRSARFLQKNYKKLQKIHLFLTHLRTKPTTFRQTENPIPAPQPPFKPKQTRSPKNLPAPAKHHNTPNSGGKPNINPF